MFDHNTISSFVSWFFGINKFSGHRHVHFERSIFEVIQVWSYVFLELVCLFVVHCFWLVAGLRILKDFDNIITEGFSCLILIICQFILYCF